MEPNAAFDFCDITGIGLQSATPADGMDLVRIEVWRSGVVGLVAAVAEAVTDARTSQWRSACPR
jgi:hypothetical protein